MKTSFGRIVAGVIVVIVVLGLLRYRPWSSVGVSANNDVIHEGSNTRATRELDGSRAAPLVLLAWPAIERLSIPDAGADGSVHR